MPLRFKLCIWSSPLRKWIFPPKQNAWFLLFWASEALGSLELRLRTSDHKTWFHKQVHERGRHNRSASPVCVKKHSQLCTAAGHPSAALVCVVPWTGPTRVGGGSTGPGAAGVGEIPSALWEPLTPYRVQERGELEKNHPHPHQYLVFTTCQALS